MIGDCGLIVLRTNAGRACGVRELHASRLRRWLAEPEEPLWRHLDCPVKISHSSMIVRGELPLSTGTLRVAFKQYRPKNWIKAICWRLRQSRARNAWRAAHALLSRGIATARPLAMWEPRQGWLFRPSYLAVEWIHSAENLHLYGWQLAKQPVAQRLRLAASCAESLGRLIGRMHARRISHRDLKGANLLVTDDPHRPKAYVIDVDGVRICRRLSSARRAANLARLAAGMQSHAWLPRTVWCRFLRAYAAQFVVEHIQWKPLWREVAARSRRIRARKRRRGEPIL